MAYALFKLHTDGLIRLHGGGVLQTHIVVPAAFIEDDDLLTAYDEEYPTMLIRENDGTAFSAITGTPTALEIQMPRGARLLVAHSITGGATGGYVSLTHALRGTDTFVPHHGEGENIKSTATTTSYSCVYRSCFPVVKLACNITDGTHTVTYQVLK